MKKFIFLTTALALLAMSLFVLLSGLPARAADVAPEAAEVVSLYQEDGAEGCLSCHDGIESIREEGSDMLKEINAKGECTTCHGGDPAVTGDIEDTDAAEEAHTGAPETVPFDQFFPDPGSVWVAGQTCGQCHTDYAHALERSLMNTEAGKIQGNLWAWGVAEDQVVRYGNYDVEDSDTMFGSDTYKSHLAALKEAYPDQFPQSLEVLPNPSVEDIEADPKLAAFTYQRQQCQRCHVGVKGRSRRGDWRGMGCSSCHVPYGNEGLYEGDDPTVPQDEAGHLLFHQIQGTRQARNGIPSETCNSCHNRGKRIGVSYQGIMEFPYGTPYDDAGQKQPRLHTKNYLFIKEDLHHEQQSRPENPEGGMLCQDCHTSLEMHGDGNIFGTTLSQVEIECADCHGTSTAYPWELPLGYGEEFAKLGDLSAEPRGVGGLADLLTLDGSLYDIQDGYLLTGRGNPFGNIVRTAEGQVIVHSATGRDFLAPLLKTLADEKAWASQNAEVAMEKVEAHVEKMECYACHADWAPQCYGCHVDVNYGVDDNGDPLTDNDWVATGNDKNSDGTHNSATSPGKVSESRSYLRWEEPILGINGEGRVTPLIPGCQVIFTVRGTEGDTLTHNEIGRTPPDTEGAGPEGQRGLDMAPVQPHTAGRQARTCESCHSNPKALGYGIDGGRYLNGYTDDRYVDLADADGNIIPANTVVQMPGIPDLPMDLSTIVDPETGLQTMTVGSHWPDSRPLDEEQRTRMERTGVCMGCHQNMADPTFWNDKVIAKFGTVMSNEEHINAMNEVIQESVADPAQGAVAAPEPAQEVAAAEPVQEQEEVAMAAPSAEVEVKLAETEARIAEAEALAAEAQARAAEAEARIAEVQVATPAEVPAAPVAPVAEVHAEEVAAATASSMTMWVIVALILGLVVGGGAVYFGRRNS
jgi:hypothetical protein